MISDGQSIATGTGFLMSIKNTDYLVTAHHCLTGKRANGEYISKYNKCQPSKIRIHFRNTNGKIICSDFDLITDEIEATWFEHPTFGPTVDVGVLPLSRLSADIRGKWTEPMKHPLSVTEDVFIVGYPYGKKGGANLPIWVRGTIATEPDVAYNDQPAFLVDARTRAGQSGSPVIAHYRPGTMVPHPQPGVLFGARTGSVTRLIGDLHSAPMIPQPS
ncbi:MAG: serine protease [Gordonia sp. (in: high G+C Gram-positive bacteria)]